MDNLELDCGELFTDSFTLSFGAQPAEHKPSDDLPTQVQTEPENKNFEELYENLLIEHEKLKNQYCIVQSENEQCAFRRTEYQNLDKQHKSLVAEREQLKKRCSVLQSEKQQYAVLQADHQNIERVYADLLVEHQELKKRYSNPQYEKEQLDTSYIEPNMKYMKLHADCAKLSHDDIDIRHGAVGSACKCDRSSLFSSAALLDFFLPAR